MIMLVILPLVAALVAFVLPTDRFRPTVVAITAVFHLVMTWRLNIWDASPDGWMAVEIGRASCSERG